MDFDKIIRANMGDILLSKHAYTVIQRKCHTASDKKKKEKPLNLIAFSNLQNVTYSTRFEIGHNV